MPILRPTNTDYEAKGLVGWFKSTFGQRPWFRDVLARRSLKDELYLIAVIDQALDTPEAARAAGVPERFFGYRVEVRIEPL
jgi:hypothetical protein